MSDMDEYYTAVQTAMHQAGEARNHAAHAQEVGQRIISAGMAAGFGNDPSLIIAANEQLSQAGGGLSGAGGYLDEAHKLISQARGSQ